MSAVSQDRLIWQNYHWHNKCFLLSINIRWLDCIKGNKNQWLYCICQSREIMSLDGTIGCKTIHTDICLIRLRSIVIVFRHKATSIFPLEWTFAPRVKSVLFRESRSLTKSRIPHITWKELLNRWVCDIYQFIILVMQAGCLLNAWTGYP